LYNGNATIPSDIYHNVWIRASYTFDGRNVLGLVHDETHGFLLPDPEKWCPSMQHNHCWMTFATVALSTDGGYTFRLNPADSRVALSTSLPYVPDGGVMGVPQHSNIVRPPGSDYVYTMSGAVCNSTTAPLPGIKGNPKLCVHRAPANPEQLLGNHSCWRAWGGEHRGYDVPMVDPWRNPVPSSANFSATHVCAGIEVPPMPWLDPITNTSHSLPVSLSSGSWSWSNITGSFIKTGEAKLPNPLPGQGDFIFVYALSPDAIHWTVPKPLKPFWGTRTAVHGEQHYPSILDPADGTMNYERTGAAPYLWAMEEEVDVQPGEDTHRNLVRWRLSVASGE